jgi:hypothetical protein
LRIRVFGEGWRGEVKKWGQAWGGGSGGRRVRKPVEMDRDGWRMDALVGLEYWALGRRVPG